MDDQLFKWIGTLGFPIVVAVIMAFALYKLGWRVIGAFEKNLIDNAEQMREQTKVLNDIHRDMPTVCRANCPNESQPLRQRKRPL